MPIILLSYCLKKLGMLPMYSNKIFFSFTLYLQQCMQQQIGYQCTSPQNNLEFRTKVIFLNIITSFQNHEDPETHLNSNHDRFRQRSSACFLCGCKEVKQQLRKSNDNCIQEYYCSLPIGIKPLKQTATSQESQNQTP